jgi:hypothetical protein
VLSRGTVEARLATVQSLRHQQGKQRGIPMDYGKTGTPKLKSANAPRHNEHNARGSDKNPFKAGNPKAELLARMKAAAEEKKGQ